MENLVLAILPSFITQFRQKVALKELLARAKRANFSVIASLLKLELLRIRKVVIELSPVWESDDDKELWFNYLCEFSPNVLSQNFVQKCCQTNFDE